MSRPRRNHRFKRPRAKTKWGQAKRGGWKFIRGTQLVTHRCHQCGKVQFAREYQVLRFWRVKDGKEQVFTRFLGGVPGQPVDIPNPCLCPAKDGQPTLRMLQAIVKGGIKRLSW
jgi:hypothetical protein